MMSLIQNAFLNTSSSMFVAKLQGTIVDLLLAPLTTVEVISAFMLGAMLRAVMVGALTWAVAGVFTGFDVAHPAWMIGFTLLVSATFALIGLVVAIASHKFEQLNIVPTFIVMPLTFLGGVFYSIKMLPEPWLTVTRANPILYMVEGLRYGMLGVSATSPWVGLGVTGGLFVASLAVTAWMIETGYRLRS